MGRAMEGIVSIFAQLDNENRAERCKNGMMNEVRDGRWMWCAPIGYINGKDVNNKHNIILDARSDYVDILRDSWYLVASDISETEAMETINRRLKSAGYKKIPRNSFSRMLRNKIYIGVVKGFGLRPKVKLFLLW